MDLNNFDWSQIIGSSPVALAIVFVSWKILKPLLESFFDDLTGAINNNTQTIKDLIEKNDRAHEHQHAEHTELITRMQVLTEHILKINGYTDRKLLKDDTDKNTKFKP